MAAALLAARLLLATVLGLAGLAKLADRDGARRAVHEFGVPTRLARPLGLLLPLVELAIATALFPSESARIAAVAAASLLTLFAVAIAVALAHGRRPDCHCFGRLKSAPAGRLTFARNIALAAIAGLVALRPAAGLGWVELTAGGIAALVAGQAWLSLELLRRHGRALRRIEELETGLPQPVRLEAGSPAPPFVLRDLDGRWAALETLPETSERVLLLFTDPGCGACDLVLSDVRGVAGATVVVISSGEPEDVAAKASSHQVETVLLDDEREVSTLYGAVAVPTAVLVDADGRLASDPAVGAPEVGELIRSLRSPRQERAVR